MNAQEILSKVDHTLLKQTATWEDIKGICEEAVKYRNRSWFPERQLQYRGQDC